MSAAKIKPFLSLLWLPLAIEVVNVITHNIARRESPNIGWIDLASIVITVGVMFFTGWAVERRGGTIWNGILAATSIWICSCVLVVLMIGLGSLQKPDAVGHWEVIEGFALSALMFAPIVIVVSALGSFMAVRIRPSKG